MLVLGVIFALPSDGDCALHGMFKIVELLADNEKIGLNALSEIGQTRVSSAVPASSCWTPRL